MKTLFSDCYVLQNGNEVLKNAYLGVDGDKICYIGTQKPAEKYDCVKNMKNKLLIPGLYNCHTHTPMVLLRGVGSDLPLDEWLFKKIFPIEDRLTPEDISAGSMLAVMEMIACGTVSFSDMYFEPQKTVEAAVSAGMKANICRPVQAFDDTPPEKSERIRQSIELYDSYNGFDNGRILVDFCVHAEYTCNESTVRYYSGLCAERHGNMHIHLSETEKEHLACIEKYGKTPAQWFEALGAFDSRAFAAHCVAVTDGDIEIMKRRGVSVVHNPTSNMKLGSGFAPLEKLFAADVNVALGTDGAASNNNLNLLEEMHLAGVIHNGFMRNATVMPPERVINMATKNGAYLQGRQNCGELKTGFKADIAAISLEAAHMYPCLDAAALLVYSAQGADVCLTMCDGRILYENGEYKTLDSEKVLFSAKKAVERLYG